MKNNLQMNLKTWAEGLACELIVMKKVPAELYKLFQFDMRFFVRLLLFFVYSKLQSAESFLMNQNLSGAEMFWRKKKKQRLPPDRRTAMNTRCDALPDVLNIKKFVLWQLRLYNLLATHEQERVGDMTAPEDHLHRLPALHFPK